MAGTSIQEYLFIRTSIILLSLIAPLSTVYSLARVLFQLPLRFPRILEDVLALETIFYLAVYLPRKAYLQRPALHPPTISREDRQRLFLRCFSNVPDPERYLKKWFRDAPLSEIKRENMKDFFRWAFLNTAHADSTYDEELDEYIDGMERLLEKNLEPGRSDVQCLRLTLEKVQMSHRSLTWYMCVFAVDTIASAYLRCHSFDFYSTSLLAVFPLRLLNLFTTRCSPSKALTYWHRPYTSKTRLPVLFVHGIGVGLYQYIDFLAEINAEDARDPSDGQVGIIALELMFVSSRLTGEALSKEAMCEEVACILNAHGWEKLVLVSHSYGSVVATQLLQSPTIARRIGPILFIDPVSFLLHLPDVAYNFPTCANEHLLSYFGAKDIGISHTLFRRFFWAESILWKEDIRKHHTTVVLCGRDAIIDSRAIAAYLTGVNHQTLHTREWNDGLWKGDGLDVLWFVDLDHGQAFDGEKTRRRLVDIVRRSCRGMKS